MIRPFTLALLVAIPCLAAEPKPEVRQAPEKKAPQEEKKVQEPVSREGSVTIDGKKIDYTVTTSKLQLKKDDGTPRASIFNVSYLRKDVEDLSQRPVMFAFNGGPGSSAVWLHLGILGPVRVAMPGDGTEAPRPPARLIPNEFSILDHTDLVFVDPVSTGYSRVEKDGKASDFHGVEEDIESIADFIRRWITENDRWSSPKYLLGESYGGVRVAGLSEHLQSRYGMSLNGVVLLSSLLDFRTLRGGDGDNLLYSVYLPTFTSVAHHHGKLTGDREALVSEARAFANGEYALALIQGNSLAPEKKKEVAATLSRLTSIDADLIEKLDLQLDPSRFRAELLRAEGKVIGRFDARVAWPAGNEADSWPSYDPSFSLALGAYSTTMLSYLTEELGWEEDSPYEILTRKVHPWKWGATNGYVNLTNRLGTALRDNPHLRVLVMEGGCDLATPLDGIRYSLNQMTDAPESALKRISHVGYDAGHMFYLNPPDLEKARKDLAAFLTAE
ncbi:S10 family peptidase [Haloferula chungangensis]|uniref:S10 family peptidase n=1 Tax=Haloferula chungangensis TaxID=1048331 RepID=A0ABW2L3J9_9BACT